MGLVLTFEASVNIVYMSLRMASDAPELHDHSAFMTFLLAGHGILSLLMFAGLVAFSVEARRAHRQGGNLIRERPRTSLAFVGFWTLSVASGELIYILQWAQ